MCPARIEGVDVIRVIARRPTIGQATRCAVPGTALETNNAAECRPAPWQCPSRLNLCLGMANSSDHALLHAGTVLEPADWLGYPGAHPSIVTAGARLQVAYSRSAAVSQDLQGCDPGAREKHLQVE